MNLSMRKQGHNNGARASIAIIGLGPFGASLAQALVEWGAEVLAIDHDPHLAQRHSPEIPCAVLDATDEAALQDVTIAAFDTVVVAIRSDFESNVLATAALKRLGVRHIISQSTTEQERKILLRVGAHRVVDTDLDAGRRLAKQLIASREQRQIPLALGTDDRRIGVLEIREELAGGTLATLELDRHGVMVLVIQRGKTTIASPAPHTILCAGDVLCVLGGMKADTSLEKSTK